MSAGHVVFLESNTTGTGALALQRLLDDGHAVTFLARRPELYPFLDEGAQARLRVETLETNDEALVARRLEALHQQQPLAVLLTFSEYYVPLVARQAARFGLPGLDPQVANVCRDKHQLRRVLREAGLPTPDFELVRSVEEARQLVARRTPELRYPCVVKPTGESSSKGVLRVDDADALLRHFELIHGWRSNARGQELAGEVLVEQLLDGPEYSVETVTRGRGAGDLTQTPVPTTEIVSVVAKHLSDPPLFVELGHDVPAPISADLAEDIAAAAVAALDAVGYDFGPAHTEVRLAAEGPTVVEINPRLAGGMIPELIRHALGLDLLQALLDLLRGRDLDLRPKRSEHASIRFLTAPRDGELVAVHGLDAVRARLEVREVTVSKAVGSPVRCATQATDRLGHVITSGPEAALVRRVAGEALAQVQIEVNPEISPPGPARGQSFRRGEGACPLVLGECVQGQLADGTHFLITLPIDVCSHAEFEVDASCTQTFVEPASCAKALLASQRYLEQQGLPQGGHLRLHTPVRPGLGFGTSTADIAAGLRATAAAWGRQISPDEISRLCIAIEPTDGSMYEGSVAYAHREGRVLERFGRLPDFVALVVVDGDSVDTVAFDERRRHFHYHPSEQEDLHRAWQLVRDAARRQDLRLMAQATQLSAGINQRLLPNPWFAELSELGRELGACGVTVAHSGSLAALLLDPSATDFEHSRQQLRTRLEHLAPGGWIEVRRAPDITTPVLTTPDLKAGET